MVPVSPVAALGVHAEIVRPLLIEVVRSIHDRFAEAHLASGSKYAMGFGSQYRDLMDAVRDALIDRGYLDHKLKPGGHKVGIVNGCLVYVWRVRDTPQAVANFASSPTRMNGFLAEPPAPMLWEPGLDVDTMPAAVTSDVATGEDVLGMMAAVSDPMPVVLVLVHSTPRQLQSIEWAVAELDDDGKVKLHGTTTIWEPEALLVGAVPEVHAFDSGVPDAPVVELQSRERPGDDD